MASSSQKVIYAALIGNGLIAITKFVASALTGSSAMLSEGVHSLVDTGNQLLLLYGLRKAKQPPDAQFPFGHGKEIYFWSFIVAILIFAVGAGVSLYEGIHHILHPEPTTNPLINYIVLGLAMIFEGFAWYFAFREFRKTKGRLGYVEAVRSGKDPTMFVVLFEDSAALIGLLVAFLGVGLGHLTGNPIYDGIAAVIIGLILASTAIWLAYETKGLLIGEAAHPRIEQDIRELAATNPRIERVNEILTMHMGPEFVLATVSVEFSDATTATEIETAVAVLDREIKRAHPIVKRLFVEAEAWQRASAAKTEN